MLFLYSLLLISRLRSPLRLLSFQTLPGIRLDPVSVVSLSRSRLDPVSRFRLSPVSVVPLSRIHLSPVSVVSVSRSHLDPFLVSVVPVSRSRLSPVSGLPLSVLRLVPALWSALLSAPSSALPSARSLNQNHHQMNPNRRMNVSLISRSYRQKNRCHQRNPRSLSSL